ncbi:hypothetical protein [Coxiella-like endosymbiont]|uniref:hypothetical protein n=1 Tax=Coxiella-like endosymbiont TaxID=1592897 RepID=UPI0018A85D05|nr:hypothetical protein [Coxiella-like endosymbiont]
MLNIDAFRIIMDDLDSCDGVLGILYGLFKPVPEYFKDYITFLKKNQMVINVLYHVFRALWFGYLSTNLSLKM